MPAEVGLHIKIVSGGRHEEFRVAGPTQTFIALRAVGRDFKIVAPLAPDDVAEELVHQRAGTGEGAGPGHIGMHDDARHRVQRGGRRQSPHFNVTEAMEGETRFIDHRAIGAENIKVRRVRAAQVGRVDRAVGIEHFAVPHGDAVAGVAADIQPDPADHVLAEIESVAAGLWHGEIGGRQGGKASRWFRNGGLHLQPADAGK
jgi:hypothetical protein